MPDDILDKTVQLIASYTLETISIQQIHATRNFRSQNSPKPKTIQVRSESLNPTDSVLHSKMQKNRLKLNQSPFLIIRQKIFIRDMDQIH